MSRIIVIFGKRSRIRLYKIFFWEVATMTEHLTTNEGQPWSDNQHSQTAGQRGPVLIQDYQLLEKLAHFNRERIPERVVHAKGAGAKGYFKVTRDMSAYTKAAVFSGVGK